MEEFACGFRIVRSKRDDGNMAEDGSQMSHIRRHAFLRIMNAPLNAIYIEPQHGGSVQIADRDDPRYCKDGMVGCDALVTGMPNVTLALLPADCPSLILYLPEYRVKARHDGRVVEMKSVAKLAHIHLGRRPLEQNIIANTLRVMLPADNVGLASTVNAVFVTGIGPCCYRFDEDAYRLVLAEHWPHLEPDEDGKYTIDLPNEARQRLRDSGVMSFNQLGECTACSGDYFSNKRAALGEKEFEGRHLVACWMEA